MKSLPLSISPRTWMRIAFFVVLLFAATIGRLPIAQAASHSPDEIHAFAVQCFEDGDFLTAAIESKRFVFFYPDDPRASAAAYQAGLAFYKMRRYEDARDAFDFLIEQYAESEDAIEGRFMLSRCRLKMNDPAGALHELRIILHRTPAPDIRDRVYHRMGWIDLENGDITEARAAFENIRREAWDRYAVGDILEGIDEPGHIPYKDPEITGILSVIPGAGYLYCGRYRDAATALFINGILAAAAYESFDNDLNVVGGLFSLLGTGFYGGSIWGSVSSAHKYNQRAYDDYINRLKESAGAELSLGVTRNAVFLVYQIPF